MLADCGFNCVSNGQDYSRTCDEIMLFGVRVRVEPMRKSVSLNNLSQYEHLNNATTTTDNDESVKAAVDDGYASADDAVPHRSSGGRERKRGVPWTEEEHKVFLLGLQKVGKGNWRGISRNYVKSRTPTQVASHAQKYFLRRTNLNRRLRRRRSSLFDITTDSDSVSPTSPEERKVSQDNLNLVPSPVTVAPAQIEKPMENMVFALGDEVSEPSSLSLKLSMSLDQSHLLFQGMSSFINGDTVVSVA